MAPFCAPVRAAGTRQTQAEHARSIHYHSQAACYAANMSLKLGHQYATASKSPSSRGNVAATFKFDPRVDAPLHTRLLSRRGRGARSAGA